MAIVSLPWVYRDGGRAAAGFRGEAGDCVTRAVAIVTGDPYRTVYDRVIALAARERPRQGRGRSDPRAGVFGQTTRRLCQSYGMVWTPTMQIGSGCRVHLRSGELPDGRLVVQVSRHVCAVLDGVLYDTSDCGREGMRCVYGCWTYTGASRV